MPYRYLIDSHKERATVTLFGQVTGTELLAVFKTLFGHSRWKPGYATLYLTEDLTNLVLGSEDLNALTEAAPKIAELRGDGQTACVTRTEDVTMVSHLLGAKTKAADNGRAVRLFNNRIAAEMWLDGAKAMRDQAA